MTRFLLITGAVLGALSVVSGAFAAHALQDTLSDRALGWYDTAVTYHARHALALLLCGVMARIGYLNRAIRVAGLALLSGTVIFSGSLYLMAFTGMTWLGAVTPIGGILLIVGWLAMAASVLATPALNASPIEASAPDVSISASQADPKR